MANNTEILQKVYSDKSVPDKGIFIEWWKKTTGKTYRTLDNKFNQNRSRFTDEEIKKVAEQLEVVLPIKNIF